jgi:hypothetical protein
VTTGIGQRMTAAHENAPRSPRCAGIISPSGAGVAGSEHHPPVVDLDAIKARFLRDEFEFTQHAVDQTLLRGITVQELREAVAGAEIIEDYPDDKYGPSCLLLGRTRASRPLHAQVSCPSRPLIKVVTVYQPDPERWLDDRYRRPLR